MDSCLQKKGRVRSFALPSETQLSRFLRNITKVHASWTEVNEACSWHRVKCHQHGFVRRLHWSGRDLRGSLYWRSLPHTVSVLFLHENLLTGEIMLGDLPHELYKIDVARNKFLGHMPIN